MKNQGAIEIQEIENGIRCISNEEKHDLDVGAPLVTLPKSRIAGEMYKILKPKLISI